MPKYYVRDGYEKRVIDAPTPERAVVMCVLHFFSSFVVNGFYVVSERGFDQHTDCEEDEEDIIFSSEYIMAIIADEFGK
jgi:uncharacterized membrane protein (DUF485 family)